MPRLSSFALPVLYGILCVFISLNKVYAQTYPDSAYRFKPRIEAKLHNSLYDHTLLATEIWAPLAQQSDQLLYGSIRYMGDNYQNFEGNIGIGYRQIAFSSNNYIEPHIMGTHLWLDRRHTRLNNTFYQAVIGTEMLGHTYDFRMNFYFPLRRSKGFMTENFGSETPYLAGYGLFYDTNGYAVEEAQKGYDLEIGRSIPFFDKYIDSARAYTGIYSFNGKKTKDVVGVRTRFEVNITPSFTFGMRSQYDEMRGTQAITELILRFPFSAKQTYDKNDLRSRLDISPERDIDIITASHLLDDGLMRPIIDPDSGKQQRVLHVDNRYASFSGTGSAEHPFAMLKDAEKSMQPNDIIYIHQGDDKSYHQDQGFVISQPNITLIGSAFDLVHQNGKITYRLPHEKGNGDILIAASSKASTITNTSFDHADGNGILIMADNTTIKGLNINNSVGNGIHILARDNEVNNVHISHVSVNKNLAEGIRITADGNMVNNIYIEDIQSGLNNNTGVLIDAKNSGYINNIIINKSIFNNNLQNGAYVASKDIYASINDVSIRNSSITQNAGHGWIGDFENGYAYNINLENNLLHNNLSSGLSVQTRNGAMAEIHAGGNIITENQLKGIELITKDVASMSFKAWENIVTDTDKNLFHSDSTGLYIDHDSRNPAFDVDLGGGALGSIGMNHFYNNGRYDLYLDTRPGDGTTSSQGKTVSAQYNYWGTSYGLNIRNGRSIIDNNESKNHYSFIDSSNYLSF